MYKWLPQHRCVQPAPPSGSGAAKTRWAQKCIRVACETQPLRRAISRVAKAVEPDRPSHGGLGGSQLAMGVPQ